MDIDEIFIIVSPFINFNIYFPVLNRLQFNTHSQIRLIILFIYLGFWRFLSLTAYFFLFLYDKANTEKVSESTSALTDKISTSCLELSFYYNFHSCSSSLYSTIWSSYYLSSAWLDSDVRSASHMLAISFFPPFV